VGDQDDVAEGTKAFGDIGDGVGKFWTSHLLTG
jgi:hypothetical protein